MYRFASDPDDSTTLSGKITTGDFNGRVIDTVTKEPLESIPIKHFVVKMVSKGFVDSDFEYVSMATYLTNENGEFEIPKKEERIPNFYSEQLLVNGPNSEYVNGLWIDTGEDYKTKSNENYSRYTRTYMKKPWKTTESDNEFFSFNEKTHDEIIIELHLKS